MAVPDTPNTKLASKLALVAIRAALRPALMWLDTISFLSVIILATHHKANLANRGGYAAQTQHERLRTFVQNTGVRWCNVLNTKHHETVDTGTKYFWNYSPLVNDTKHAYA